MDEARSLLQECMIFVPYTVFTSLSNDFALLKSAYGWIIIAPLRADFFILLFMAFMHVVLCLLITPQNVFESDESTSILAPKYQVYPSRWWILFFFSFLSWHQSMFCTSHSIVLSSNILARRVYLLSGSAKHGGLLRME